MKKFILLFTLLILGLCTLGSMKKSDEIELTTLITTLSIKEMLAKNLDSNNYYLTVAVDDFVIDEYRLSYTELTIPVEKSLYEKVSADNSYVSISLEIIVPSHQSSNDLRLIFRDANTEYWKIIGITDSSNVIID